METTNETTIPEKRFFPEDFSGGYGPVPEEMLVNRRKISPSSVGHFYESPAHYESAVILKEMEETDAMAFGTAMHMAILEPEKFKQRYVAEIVPPDGVLKTQDDMKGVLANAGAKTSGSKAEQKSRIIDLGLKNLFYDDWLTSHMAGRELLSEKEWRSCERLKDRVKANPKLQYMITDGDAEMKAWWLHKRTNTIISMRLDYVKRFRNPIGGCVGVIADVKKVPKGNCRRFKFERLLWERKMFLQAAMYVDGMEQLTGEKWMFIWVAGEQNMPYPVQGFTADFGLLEAGRNEYNKAIDGILDCYKRSHWPCYSEELINTTLPKYAWDQLEVRDEEMEATE
jgi:hypothetical protein